MPATILGIATATPAHARSGQEINELFDKHAKPSKACEHLIVIDLHIPLSSNTEPSSSLPSQTFEDQVYQPPDGYPDEALCSR